MINNSCRLFPSCPFYWHDGSKHTKVIISIISWGQKSLIHFHWSLGICKPFHPTLDCIYWNLSMLNLKLNHISKRVPSNQATTSSSRLQWMRTARRNCWGIEIKLMDQNRFRTYIAGFVVRYCLSNISVNAIALNIAATSVTKPSQRNIIFQ